MAALGLALAGPASAASGEIPPCHGTPTPYKLLITTLGLRSDHGYLVANVYGSDRKRWLADNGWLAVWRDPAVRGEEIMCVYLPAPGRYALVMFHDTNSDGELNMGPFGPKEGFGFSNNVIPILTAPPLSTALFTVAAGETYVSIRIHYPPIL
jgi:uncharacterized protein (DUF2141 family)